MQNQTGTPIRCQSCGQPFNAELRTVIDVMKEPQLKAELLSGRLNNARCPHCGTPNAVTTPILYHDATKELLIALVPMELNLPKDEQEKIIGDMMNHLPKDDFKAYMFNPTRALTMQGLMDQVLEADGITPEMMEQQRARVRLAQQFVEAPENDLENLVKQHDEQIDTQFFQTLTMIAQRMLEGGQAEAAQQVIQRQSRIAELSTHGQELIQQQEQQQQTVQRVADRIQQLGAGADRADFMALAIEFKDDDNALQALVGLARPAFDYEFFQQMTARIGEAPAAEREGLNSLRQRLVELTSAIDQQTQMAAQNAAGFLQALVNSQEPEQLIRENIQIIDDTFMAVLTSNIQQAEQQKNIQLASRLKELYNMIVTLLQESMGPEMRFINDLLSAPDDAQAEIMLQERASEFGPDLLEVMDAIEHMLEEQGNHPLLGRMKSLKQAAQQVISG